MRKWWCLLPRLRHLRHLSARGQDADGKQAAAFGGHKVFKATMNAITDAEALSVGST